MIPAFLILRTIADALQSLPDTPLSTLRLYLHISRFHLHRLMAATLLLRQQPKVFANITDCSVVGYNRYLIALFAILFTLRLYILFNNVYGNTTCGQETEAL